MSSLVFPPLMSGQEVEANVDPFENACGRAALGCDSGLVVYRFDPDWLRAAIVFAPEVPLEDAVVMMPACGVGFQNALGALAPPEVAVHLEWSGGIRVNGAACGRLRMAASSKVPSVEPDWLIVGIEIPLLPAGDSPGNDPARTTLFEEGCAEVEPPRLLESWTKHTLVWINRWVGEGVEPLHEAWRGLAHNMGEETAELGHSGVFLGVDERFGMLLRKGDDTDLLPLTLLLEGEE
ncbi:MAG: DUF4444 domain-containing protein [Rhizobiaceae bacterium]